MGVSKQLCKEFQQNFKFFFNLRRNKSFSIAPA